MRATRNFVYVVYRFIDGKNSGIVDFCFNLEADAVEFCKTANRLKFEFEYRVGILEVM